MGQTTTAPATRWYAGTSGYSYKEWRGHFYPPELGNDAMLPYYAVQLPAVEINNTFYRMPRTHVLEGWHDAVGSDFRFIIKASRRITHQLKLEDAAEPVGYLAGKLEALGDKLGAVLFQLPPYLRRDLDRLRRFLDVLPRQLPAAFEFRHASWFDDEVLDALVEQARGLCVSDDGKLELPPRFATTGWAYLRLRQPGYTDEAMREWIGRVQDTGATTAYAFFKHEDEGAGPALARRFLDLATEGASDLAPEGATDPAPEGARTARPPRRAAARRRATRREEQG